MKLYGYWRSSAAYRVRIALNLKGIDCEGVSVDLRPQVRAQHDPAFRAINPQSLVPVLEDEDAQAPLTQSLAIIEYLEERHPEPPLLPADPLGRAQVRALALTVACDVHPLNNSRVLGYLRDPLSCDQAAIDRWYVHWVTLGLQTLESRAAQWSDGRHLHGDSVTLADVCLVPQLYNARRFNTDLGPFPRLRAICAHLEALPAFARAAPEVQPDAEPPPQAG